MHRKAGGWRIVAFAIGSIIVTSCGSPETADPGAAQGAEAGWHGMPDPPVAARLGPALAARDDDVFLFGGHRADGGDGEFATDGAIYSGETASWKAFAGPREGAIGAAHALASDAGWLVSGYLCRRGDLSANCASDEAAFFEFDEAENAWAALPKPAGAALLVPLGRVNGQVLYSIGSGDDATRRYGAFKPATREWQLFDAPPFRVRGQSCLAGGSVAVLTYRFQLPGGEVTDREPGVPNGAPKAPDKYVESSISLVDASGRWTPPIPVEPGLRSSAPPELGCTAGHVVVFGTDGYAVYDLTARTWLGAPSSLPVPPGRRIDEFRYIIFMSGDRLFMWGVAAEGLSYDPAANEWRPFPAGATEGSQVTATQTGAVLYVSPSASDRRPSTFRYVRGSGSTEKPFPVERRPS